MRPSARRPAALVIAATLLAACSGGGDDGGPRGGPLSAREAGAVATAVFAELGRALSNVDVGAAPRARALAPAAFRAAADDGMSGSLSGNCQRGGRITLEYRYASNMNSAGTGTMTGTMKLTPQGCVVSTGERDITVNGAPSLDFTYTAAYTNGEPTATTSFRGTGGFTWSGGNCMMDYTVTMTPQGGGRASGTVCGERIDQAFGAD
jgi:hypothetical protein